MRIDHPRGHWQTVTYVFELREMSKMGSGHLSKYAEATMEHFTAMEAAEVALRFAQATMFAFP